MNESIAGVTLPSDRRMPWWTWPTRLSQMAIDALKRCAGEGIFDRVSTTVGRLGLLALVIAAVAALVFQVTMAIRTDSLSTALIALAIPIGLCVLQFAASRFTDLGEAIVRNTPTSASGLVLYELLGLTMLLSGAGLGGMGIYAAVDQAEPRSAILGVLLLFGLGTVGVMFLTPSALNLHVRDRNSAGEDGLSVIGTFIKAYLAGSRLIFGCCAILGGIACAVGAVWFLFDRDPRPIGYVMAGATLAVYGAILPLVFYIFAIVYFILVDALMAIMRMAPAERR